MDRHDELKEINTKNRTCYCFDDTILIFIISLKTKSYTKTF